MYAKAEEIFNDIPTFVFIIALIGLIVGFISGNSFLGRVLLGAIIGIGVLWLVDKIVKAFTVDKRTKAKNDYIDAHLPQLNQRIADIQSQMVDLVNSEDGLWAIDVVGDEFFCTPFVKELMSYLSSRRADNLKEAIQQYDLHTHNFNMESMQADIKDASERTAIEAAKQTEYAKQTEKNTKATANAAKANAVINYATYKNVKKIRKSLK